MSLTVTQTESSGIPTADELGFDPGALREKYAAERTKRLRADANNQYREISGQFAHYNEDHYVEPGYTRPALHEELDAVIVGGGFGGQLAAVRLQEAGITNFRIIEKPVILAGPGTGTAIPALSVTSKAISICPCWRRPATSRRNATPSPRKSLPTPNGSASTSICTTKPASRRRSKRPAGMRSPDAGPSPPIGAIRSRRALCSCRVDR